MKKTYVMMAAAAVAAVACTKSDTIPADSLSLSASQAAPLDSLTAAERAAQVAPVSDAPAAMAPTTTRSSSTSAGSGGAPTNSGTSMSATSQANVARTHAKPSDAVLRQKLTKLQYSVTQQDDTETPYRNQYWNNHAAGIYVDVVSGEPLFSSADKYESHTGWPSFTKPLEPENIRHGSDTKLGYERTEIRSAHANSHLGHLFNDGPKPAGLRYCMNSAALRFVPVSRLAAEGYAQYIPLFRKRGT